MTTPLLKASDEAEFKRLYREYYAYPEGASGAVDAEWIRLQAAGIAEKPLEEGWYWVKLADGDEWVVAECGEAGDWFLPGNPHRHSNPAVIGPRILPPDGDA